MNIGLLLDMAAQACAERTAVGSRGSGATFETLHGDALAVAASIAARGADRLVLAAESSEHSPALLFGAAYAGVPFCSVNYRLADDRLRSVLARTAPALVVVDGGTAERVRAVPGLSVVTAAELVHEPAADGGPAAAGDPADPAGDSVAITLFTSGTTGEPKSVLLRHRNLFSYIVGTVELAAAGEDEAALVSVPPYHIAGLAAILSNVYLGRRIVYLPQFDPAAWVESAARERVTHAMIVPTMLGRILDVVEAGDADLGALRHLSYGGGRMPIATIERAMRLLPGVDFVNAYGLTETSSTVALLTPQDHRDALAGDDPAVAARLGSVGRATPGVQVEVRDADGAVLPAGEIGEIHVRGEQVAGEYEGRLALDADGWFATNDLGRLDEAGFLFLEGRADDVIVRGGENLSPGEIEDVLLTHPAVAEAAVIGVPDEEWGESPAAFVVLEPGRTADADELRAWVRGQLRSSRMPSLVVEREALPYSETGKLLRRVLRAEAAAPTSR
ncbi:Acyl-CoA synthetase (AMP-forming)/AMP-acid ligase II [Jatrophihabitans endophyticus]|uniref:Acyl-CoA synthetase (AMP-forming)/AMP-acid ligase II n=1 Tax=Jatrophihabitans endophyticus TaxID=1206085 RepID=A0A1M5PS69_9ACTN|nr:fatty acid--CoA ligase family protein [Jatrophihabitans endophyticus]SHH04777.1 Acyl-CoA synthetase (AMP-forming)/AMP-acid ligase II [Jatrophihabitans endophyticus]